MNVVSGFYDPAQLEERISSWWNQNKIFQKLVELRKDGPLFRFLEGPPTANGFMHVGHARGRTMKDVVLRLRTMQGHHVWRQAGWDCQGLPVELEVEKKLGLTSKKEIEGKIGLQKFVEQCQDLVDFYVDHWRRASEKLGLWLDYDNAYQTREESYLEFVWWALKKADQRGMLVEDFKVVPTCPRCETPLSSHEVAQGYATVTDPSLYVKFRLQSKEKEFIVIWTTTPWTLPGDEAVCVHPSYDYAKVRVGDEIWIMAKQLVETVMKNLGMARYEISEVVAGKELEGLKYVHPLLEEVPVHKEHRGNFDHAIICGEHVTLEEGTGCVHTAPAHGPEDFEMSKKYKLPVFCPVDVSGRFTKEGGKYAGKYVKEADSMILEDLRKKEILLKAGTIEHEYPFCWRCEAPLVYRADKQWFLKIDPIKAEILRKNKRVKWVPEWAGSSRFEDWLVNAEDWCVSRSRVWGSPLNVWTCEKCGDKHVVGTVKELKSLAKSLPRHLELHRPWIDQVILKCPKCGGDMKRVDYVLDCWFDSGVAHAAAIDYLEDNTLFDKLYPYDFVTEAVDQTRGWFYSLIFTGVMLFSKSPYKSVLCQGLIFDKYGQKMSKSKGNVVWALDAMQKVGVDPLRLYMLWKSPPWDALAFDYDEVGQIKRWLSILRNVFAFATTYMDLDEFDPERWTTEKLKKHLRPEDRWLLSRTHSLVKDVTASLEALSLHQPARSVLTFITEDLSRFYIRLVRRRTWVEKEDPDKLAAYATLYKSLSTLLRLLAPFAPYLTEDLYQHLVRSVNSTAPESVHMCYWPTPEEEWIDKKLEDQMEVVKAVISTAFHARQKARLKLRWPIKTVYVVPSDDEVTKAMKDLCDVFLDQVNAKALEILKVGEKPKDVKIVAGLNYAEAGPRFKDKVSEVAEHLKEADGKLVMQKLLEEGKYSLRLRDGTDVDLMSELLVFKEELPDNLTFGDSIHAKVYIDTTRTPELLKESLAKEVVRRTQLMRKEMDLRVEEYVVLLVQAQEKETLDTLKGMRDYLMTEVRARDLHLLGPEQPFKPSKEAYVKEWIVDGETVKIAVTQLGED